MYVLSCSSVATGWHAGEDYRAELRQDVRNCVNYSKATIIHAETRRIRSFFD